MSREFVRNIKNAIIKGENQEPLRTNIQNDLLSDGEDVAVRNGDEYHLLTDNIKEITSANSNIVINRTGKNSVELVGRGGDGEGSPDVLIEVIENSKEYIELINPETNHFQIGLTGDFITNIENINQAIADIPEMPDMDNYYTKEEITTIVQGITVDLSDYYNKEEIDQKIDEINTGDFEQVQSDWNETDDTKKSFIQNKPTIPDPVNLDDYYNKEEVDTKIGEIETGDFEQVQSDWKETDDTKKSFIQNKPTIPSLENYPTKAEVDNEYMKKDEINTIITNNNINENTSLIPIGLYYDRVNKILRFRFYNNINIPIRLREIKTFIPANNGFNSTGSHYSLSSGVLEKQISQQKGGSHNISVTGNFLQGLENYLTRNEGKPLSLPYIVRAIILYNNNPVDIVYRFEKIVTVFDDLEPVQYSDEGQDEKEEIEVE